MLHAMRIGCQAFALQHDTIRAALPDGLQETIKTTRTIQDHLGELHDCDV